MRLVILVLAIIFTSCSNEVEVYFPSNFVVDNKVILNSKHDLKDYIQDKEYSSITVKEGEIKVSINGDLRLVETKHGGLLNLNKEEFVIFPIIYGENNWAQNIMPHSVVVDSTIFYKHNTRFKEEFYLKYHLPDHGDKKSLKLTNGMRSIHKEQFFQERRWDISLNEDPPEEINVQFREGNLNKTSSRRSVIRNANHFKVYAILSGDYSTISLRK